MAETKIEWADRVWNPVVGCTPASEGCRNCYAKPMFERFHPGEKFSEVRCLKERLDQPLHWKKPSRIFVNSMSDLFHPDVPNEFIAKVFAICRMAEEHSFLILTKRPDRMKELLNSSNFYKNATERSAWFADNGPSVEPSVANVWLGVSVENQKAADDRIPLLLKTPAAVRFVSCEPLLGQVDLGKYLTPALSTGGEGGRLDWVICGGESGPNARPMHPDWARDLRDQCQNAAVPFFFKQWGEWTAEFPHLSLANRVQKFIYDREFYRIGKKLAGRLLDGQEWNQFPEVRK